jgi:hypothetical protein
MKTTCVNALFSYLTNSALPIGAHGFDGLLQAKENLVTGPELKQLREDLGEAIGRPLSIADMAKLCGLESADGADTIRRWEIAGPSGSAAKSLRILAMASDRHPILENFNIFDRWDVDEKERPARRAAFREKMRDEIRQRLA